MSKDLKNNLLASALFCLVVLWQLLLPGYVLTLDMVFSPHITSFLAGGQFANTLPLMYLLRFLNLFLSGWIIEKIILVALFFGLFYLALRFLPVPKKYGANYFAALLYSFNPFVYERFLAGHWLHLCAYAFLPAFIFYLLKFSHAVSRQNLLYLLFWLLLIGVFSLHFLVMAILASGLYFLVIFFKLGKNYWQKKIGRAEILRFGKYVVSLGALFFLASSYWLLPYFINRQGALLNVFNTNNQLVFRTAGNGGWQVMGKVLSLYGFWGEREVWAHYFLWPQSQPVLWLSTGLILLSLVFLGVWRAIRERRQEAYFFLVLGVLAFILSCGLGDGPFKIFNAWLFTHLGFWRGFRDTQKFSGLLVLAYAYFSAYGFLSAANYFSQKFLKISEYLLLALFLVPIIYIYPLFGGFARQIQPVWYPASWYQAQNILAKDQGDYQVLFLPWHQYFSLDFNRNIITANPAKPFFGDKIVQGDNMEIGGIFSQSRDAGNLRVQDIVLAEQKKSEDSVKLLAGEKVKYILVMDQTAAADYLKYPFLTAPNLKLIYRGENLSLYQVLVYN